MNLQFAFQSTALISKLTTRTEGRHPLPKSYYLPVSLSFPSITLLVSIFRTVVGRFAELALIRIVGVLALDCQSFADSAAGPLASSAESVG